MQEIKQIFIKVYNKVSNMSTDKKRNVYLVITFLIGLLLIAPNDITWARDRMDYLEYAKSSWMILQRNFARGFLSFLSNEPLFLTINIVLSFIISPENIVRIIIFTSTVGVLYSLGKMSKYNFWVLVFFLLVPQIVKNHVIHLRQGLALSFYLFGLTSNKSYGKVVKYASIFIHTSFLFLILFEVLEWVYKKLKLSFTLRMIASTVFLSAFIFMIPYIARLIGDRRVTEYNFEIAKGASGLGFLIWLVVGGLFIFYIRKNYISILSCYGIILYLVSYYFLEFGVRIFENILPLILISALNDDRKEVIIFSRLFFVLYGVMLWYSKGMSFLIG